jgi:hypothetical protein
LAQKNSNYLQGLKSAILAIFQTVQCWDGRALLVWPSRIPRWISKNIFALGSYEFLAMLAGKTRKSLFF